MANMLMNKAVGIGAAVVLEPVLDNLVNRFIPLASPVDDIAKFFLAQKFLKGKGIVGQAGRAIQTLALASAVRSLIGGGGLIQLAAPAAGAVGNFQ